MHALPLHASSTQLPATGQRPAGLPCAGGCGAGSRDSGCPVRGLRRVETIASLGRDGRLPVRRDESLEQFERSA
ncbi:hypothetical protein EG850_12165 [Gulosibacter macacae]|uniref:Uncharacterized protein n=1 Tax=Gulosibacter macacae TaxID=2488791 RepID=A0A3P3VVT6_9MICO|nr:hypothetical protein [Gulosibacter macacae]RRJ85736.1 hypothetical protein EG850_12165 [Gulosibacter macacae]